MSRSLWKGPDFNLRLNKKIVTKAKKNTLVYAKNLTISEEFLDKNFILYLGDSLNNTRFTASSHKIGYKLGQFGITKNFTWKEVEKKSQKKKAKKIISNV